MVRRISGRPVWLLVFAIIGALTIAMPAAAQSTGILKGTVTDDKGQPVEAAVITIQMSGGTGRRFETKSNKKGEYIQVGIPPGQYEISAEKDKMGSAPAGYRVRASNTGEVNLVLAGASASANKENAAKATELKKIFDEGVALSSAGKHSEAIEKFTAGTTLVPSCYDCYNNIGFSYAQMKEWDKAEAAYKKSIEVKPDDANAYSGLATVYNAQRKFDLAAEASAKATQYAGTLNAAGGASGNADALYNQAVILFNQGKSAEAAPLLQQAVQANPTNADAHYLLGMTLVGTDPAKALPEFEAYLKLAPQGPADKVKMAQDVVAALKK